MRRKRMAFLFFLEFPLDAREPSRNSLIRYMADDAQRAGHLRPTVDQMAERFAASCGSSGSRREIRDLADDLLLDLIGTLGRASLGEIAQTVEALERRRRLRPPGQPGKSSGARRNVEIRERRSRHPEADTSQPFDITSPSELLDQVTLESMQLKLGREEEPPPPASVTRVRRQESAERPAPPARTEARERESVEEASAPPRAAIALREGEQLVRSSGSGLVIRRARTA